MSSVTAPELESRRRTVHLSRLLEYEISSRQSFQSIQMDLEAGNLIAVDITFDEGAGARSVEVQLTGDAGESRAIECQEFEA